MNVENIKNYEVRVIKSTKTDSKGVLIPHDPTQPQPIEDDKDGHFAKDRCFYQLSLLAPKINGKRAQKGKIPFNVFNSNDQIVLFNDIADTIALGEGPGYTIASNGDLLINKSELVIGGCMKEEVCFKYKVMTRKNGKLEQLMSWKKDEKGNLKLTPSTRSIVKVFVHEEEDEDVRIATEKDRVRPYKVSEAPANSNNGDVDIDTTE
jgi:hypothetical protein